MITPSNGIRLLNWHNEVNRRARSPREDLRPDVAAFSGLTDTDRAASARASAVASTENADALQLLIAPERVRRTFGTVCPVCSTLTNAGAKPRPGLSGVSDPA